MGAYYNATIKFADDKNSKWVKYNSWDCDNSPKLMAHSHIGNLYISSVLSLLYSRKGHLVWLCDYHEDKKLNWDTVENAESWNPTPLKKPYIIANHSKKKFISLKGILSAVLKKIEINDLKYADFHVFEENGEEKIGLFIIHPLPLLVNSEKGAAGGGDYYHNYPMRRKWAKDIIEVLDEDKETELIKNNYKDISDKTIVPMKWYFEELDTRRFLFEKFLRENIGDSFYDIKTKIKAVEEYFLKSF